MQKIVFLFILLFSLKVSAQIDSLSIDSIPILEFDRYSMVIPFSSNSLNNLPIISKNIILQENNNLKSYFFLFLLNLIAIAVFLLSISRAKVKKLIATLFSLNMLMQYAQVETKRDNSYLWAYFVLFIIFISAIIYVLALNFNLNLDVSKLTLFLLTFIVLDFLIIFFTTYVLKLDQLREISHFNNFSFILITLPFLVLSLLVLLFLNIQNTIILGIIILMVLVICYVWKELRNILILKANRINIFSFYFFLYLCTFKILPMVIFIKVIYSEIFKLST